MNVKGKNKKIVLDLLQITQIEALAPYLTIEKIAEHLGFCEASFHNIKNRQPEVLRAYNRGIINTHILAGTTLIGFLKEKQNTPTKLNTTMFYLTHQAGWVKKQKQ